MESIKPQADSTLILMREAARRGHALFHYTPDKLSLKDGAPIAKASALTLREGTENYYTLSEPKPLSLAEADVVLMRQDPPFDMAYISATYMLERLTKTLVVNNPKSVRDNPEKLFPLQFPQFIPPTLISANADDIRAFHREQGEIVLKPLYGFGGNAVFHIGRNGANLNALVELLFAQSSEPLVAQRFLPEVTSGERRIVLINGNATGIYARIPATGEMRANVHSGGTPRPAEFTPRQREICDAVGPVLRDAGLLLVGLDVIGDWLTEINITSPTGLAGLNEFYGLTPERDFWDAVERRL